MDAIVQESKVVNVLHPVSVSAAATGDYICMKNYQHISLIVNVGTLTTGGLLQLKEAKDASATSAAVIDPGHYWISGTTPSDTFTKTSTSSSATATTTASKVYVFELDGAQLSDGFDWVTLYMPTSAASAMIMGAQAILSKPRYASAAPPTAIA